MKWKMAAAALLMTVGGALAQADGRHTALQGAHARLTDCFERNAGSLDDKISDARTIARAVLANCTAERNAVETAAQAMVRGVPIDAATRNEVRESMVDRATVVVLALRRASKP